MKKLRNGLVVIMIGIPIMWHLVSSLSCSGRDKDLGDETTVVYINLPLTADTSLYFFRAYQDLTAWDNEDSIRTIWAFPREWDADQIDLINGQKHLLYHKFTLDPFCGVLLFDVRSPAGYSSWSEPEYDDISAYLENFEYISDNFLTTPPSHLHLCLDSLWANPRPEGMTWVVAEVLDESGRDISSDDSWMCMTDNEYTFFKSTKLKYVPGVMICGDEDSEYFSDRTEAFGSYAISVVSDSMYLEVNIVGHENIPEPMQILSSDFGTIMLKAIRDNDEVGFIKLAHKNNTIFQQHQ